MSFAGSGAVAAALISLYIFIDSHIMPSGRNRALKLLAGALALAAAAAVAVVLFFPAERLKNEAEAKLSESIGVPVQIEKIGLRLFSPTGITLSKLQVGKEPTETFPFIRVKNLHVGLRLLPLLSKKVEISKIEILEPEITVLLSDKKEASSKIDKNAEETDFELELERLTLTNGKITVLSKNEKPLLEINGLNESLTAKAIGSKEIHLSGVLSIQELLYHSPAGTLGQGLSLELDKKISYFPKEGRLDISKGEVKLGDLPLAAKGQVTGLQSDQPSIDMTIQGGPANVKSIIGYLPASAFPMIKGVKSSGSLQIDIMAKGPLPKDGKDDLDYRVMIRLKDGSLTYPKLSQSIRNIQLTIDADPKSLRISKVHAETQKSNVHVSGKILSYRTKPKLDLSVEALVDLEEAVAMQPQLQGAKVGGTAQVKLKVAGLPDEVTKMDFDGQAMLKNVAYTDPKTDLPPLEGLNGGISLNRQSSALKNVEGKLGQSDFKMSGTLKGLPALYSDKNENEKLVFDFDLASQNLNLDELTPKTKKEEKSDPKEFIALLNRFEGKVAVSAQKARYNGINAKNAKGVAYLRDGIFDLKGFTLQSFGGTIGMGGKVNYANPNQPHFDMALKVEKVKMGDLLSYSKGLNQFGKLAGYFTGDLSTDISFKGDLNDKLELNMETLQSMGNLNVASATLSGHPVQNNLSNFLQAPSLKSLSLKSWFQPFEIKNGALDVKNMKLAAKDFDVTINGSQSITGKLAMDLDMNLPQNLSNGIKSRIPSQAVPILFDGSSSKIQVPLNMTGLITSPKLGVDQKKLATGVETRLKSQLAAKKQKLQNNLQKKASGFLTNQLAGEKKKKENPSPPSPKKAKDKVKGILKDLF